ncbi:MAG: peptide chain release factor N(5)-glutamine methyltransferase, partial [Acidobacteria bacterium]|nr:peptide chain release factor N(5)-glutamine methyltransferase [Acidobacteriota bacterium]MDW7985033.1 peptide chain release factor N(5)-glutamine methyltransferase [Acidobacteriota bacterium]
MQARTLIQEAFRRVRERFPDFSTEHAFLLLVRLLADGLHTSPESVLADLRQDVPPSVEARFRALVDRWLSGWPLQYVVGTWAFWDMTDLVVPTGVFIPRPETETLV